MTTELKTKVRRIEVTWSDIKLGCRERAKACPYALALQRVIPEAKIILVAPHSTDVHYHNNTWDTYEHSEELTDWINRFDTGLPVEPFSINLVLQR